MNEEERCGIVVTLPATNTVSEDFEIKFKKIGTSKNKVIIKCNDFETIDLISKEEE